MFKEQIILENEHVLLRPLQKDDLNHLQPFVINEPDLWKYSLTQITIVEHLEEYIHKAVEARELEKEYPFIVKYKKSNTYVGSTRFYDVQLENKSLQLGYTWYGKAFQGSNINKNCKLLLLQYAFETLGVERVEFRADNRNERSKLAMKSIGCVEEGVLRNHLPTAEGGRRDSIVLSILRKEWEGGVKENLIRKIAEKG